MRFNDLIDTVLSSPAVGVDAPVTRWRQCVDLLAQFDRRYDARGQAVLTLAEARQVVSALGSLSSRLTIAQRLASVVELGARIESPLLIGLLANDHSAVCSAGMARARLDDAAWATLVPTIGPLARSILRRRSDLSPAVRAMLAQFGATDMSLPPATLATALPQAASVAPSLVPYPPQEVKAATSEIAKIVDRIEQFRSERERTRLPAGTHALPGDRPVESVSDEMPVNFTFEADMLGVIQQVTGAPVTAIVGCSIAVATVDGRSGPDGQMLGAFRRRAAFSDFRFVLAEGKLAGEWRINGAPLFDPVNGRFLGYKGVARRPTAREQSLSLLTNGAKTEVASLNPATARQLVHELRTPLNAIQGFAEIIEQQLMGPVAEPYRAMARQILEDAARLIGLFDDLDLASRIARGETATRTSAIDLVAMVRGALERQLAKPSVALDGGQDRYALEVQEDLPAAMVDRMQAERMIAHLVRIADCALAPTDRLAVDLSADQRGVVLTIARPPSLNGLSERVLLDPTTSFEQEDVDGPPLGIAFGLRLVRSIAQNAGGQLTILQDEIVLRLPIDRMQRGEGRHI